VWALNWVWTSATASTSRAGRRRTGSDIPPILTLRYQATDNIGLQGTFSTAKAAGRPGCNCFFPSDGLPTPS